MVNVSDRFSHLSSRRHEWRGFDSPSFHSHCPPYYSHSAPARETALAPSLAFYHHYLCQQKVAALQLPPARETALAPSLAFYRHYMCQQKSLRCSYLPESARSLLCSPKKGRSVRMWNKVTWEGPWRLKTSGFGTGHRYRDTLFH